MDDYHEDEREGRKLPPCRFHFDSDLDYYEALDEYRGIEDDCEDE